MIQKLSLPQRLRQIVPLVKRRSGYLSPLFESFQFKTQSSVKDVPGVKTGGDKLIMMFTCNICETRSAKTISKLAYNTGVVVTICPNCSSKHLIVDHLGIFEEKGWTIQDYLQHTKGEKSKGLVTDETVYELTAEDVIGTHHKILTLDDDVESSTKSLF